MKELKFVLFVLGFQVLCAQETSFITDQGMEIELPQFESDTIQNLYDYINSEIAFRPEYFQNENEVVNAIVSIKVDSNSNYKLNYVHGTVTSQLKEEIERTFKKLDHWNVGKVFDKPMNISVDYLLKFQILGENKDQYSLTISVNNAFIYVDIDDKEKTRIAEFPGGDQKMIDFIRDTKVIPRVVREGKISGTVNVSFVISEDGNISNIEIKTPLEKTCDEEAMRIIKRMPKWKPALENGVPIKIHMTLPIGFTWGNNYYASIIDRIKTNQTRKSRKKSIDSLKYYGNLETLDTSDLIKNNYRKGFHAYLVENNKTACHYIALSKKYGKEDDQYGLIQRICPDYIDLVLEKATDSIFVYEILDDAIELKGHPYKLYLKKIQYAQNLEMEEDICPTIMNYYHNGGEKRALNLMKNLCKESFDRIMNSSEN